MNKQLFVQKGSQWHEVETDFNLSLVLNSEFLGQTQSGSISFPVNCPLTDKNRPFLEGIENPQIVANRRIEYPCKFLVGSQMIENWSFVVREISYRSYRFDLVKTPGNQTRNFYEKKLHQLDFGKTTLSSVQKKSGIWSIDLFPEYPPNFYAKVTGGKIMAFLLYINGQIVCNSPSIENYYDSDNYYQQMKRLADPYTHINNYFDKTINLNNNNYTVLFNIQEAGKGTLDIILKNSTFAITSASIQVFNWAIGMGTGTNNLPINRTEKLAEYVFQELKYNDITDSINTLQDDIGPKPFRFITYFNDSFYPSDDTNYEGIVNQYDSINRLKFNSISNRTAYPISPCFSLVFILTQVAQMMGYTLESSIFQDYNLDDYLGEIYLINNVDLAKQLTGTSIPYNVYNEVIEYREFMPDMTVKEFIDAVRTTFALTVDFDYQNERMIVEKMDTLLKSNDFIDISDLVAPYPKADISDKKYYQLALKDGDDNTKLLRSYPRDSEIANSSLNYIKLETGFAPALNGRDLDEFLNNDPFPHIPTVSDAARTPIYKDQANNRPTQKLVFLNALTANNQDGSISTSADNKNEKLILSWRNEDTLKGLYEAFWKSYIEFLNNTTQYSTDIMLDDRQIANWRFSKKYIAYGTVFLAESLQAKLPVQKESQLKLLSL